MSNHPIAGRRALALGGMAAAVAGLVAPVPADAAVASSPILGAGRQIAALYRQYEQADVPGAPSGVVEGIWEQVWGLEEVILAATPATVTEAMVVQMVAAGSLDTASASVYDGHVFDRAMRASTRATLCLAGAMHVSAEEFGGTLYLREGAALSCAEGVA